MNWDGASGSFKGYAQAQRAAEEIVAARGIPRRAVAIRPVGMRIARKRIAGTIAARRPARLADDPLDRASRYTVIVDNSEPAIPSGQRRN